MTTPTGNRQPLFQATPVERAAVFLALSHALLREEVEVPEDVLIVQRAIHAELDEGETPLPGRDWVEALSRQGRDCLWASLWASVRDVPEPVEALDVDSVRAGRRLMEALDNDPEIAPLIAPDEDAATFRM